MSKVFELVKQRNELSLKVKEIEESFEGGHEEKILEAIKNQRFYFFKNKKEILFDKDTGLLWANMDYFTELKDKQCDSDALRNEILNLIKVEGIENWRIPTDVEVRVFVNSNFPFKNYADGWLYSCSGLKSMHCNGTMFDYIYNTPRLCPCTDYLIAGTDYVKDKALDKIYGESERLKFTLDLFLKHNLIPIFDDEEANEIYRENYLEKPNLIKQLEDLQFQIDNSKGNLLFNFDHALFLEKIDVNSIDKSIIQYYQNVQKWVNDLMDNLSDYENEIKKTISDINSISSKFYGEYENSPSLTDDENNLFSNRKNYFQKKLSVNLNSTKSKIIAVKKQADDLENRIDEIDNGNDSIRQLALLEKEERASFALVAENTSKIVKNTLQKIEYFQNNQEFIKNSVDILEKWTNDYKIFKTTHLDRFKNFCEKDGIEETVWENWYEDWRKIRFDIEQKIDSIIKRGLNSEILTVNKIKTTVPELIVKSLEKYKSQIDKFFSGNRKAIYQKFVFQTGGDLQEKFEVESELYKCTVSLQTDLQEIIFNCEKAEDSMFILELTNSLLNLQVDEIVNFIADKNLNEISKTILSEFSKLKIKNYDIYLADAKSYSEEKARRESEYNSLIFKMRKGLKEGEKNNRKK